MNEPKAAWFVINSQDDIIGSYGGLPGTLELNAKEMTAARATAIQRIHAWYAWLAGTAHVVDKYPEIVFRRSYVDTAYPAGRWLIIVRSPWGTAESVQRWSAEHSMSKAPGIETWWGVNDRKWLHIAAIFQSTAPTGIASVVAIKDDVTRALVEWTVTAEASLRRTQEEPERSLLIKHEDLCANPAEVMRGVFLFLNLSPSSSALEYSSSAVHSIPEIQPFFVAGHLGERLARLCKTLGYPVGSID